MEESHSALKTYIIATVPFGLISLPNSCDDWTSIFELIGAILAVILVSWRLYREATTKINPNKENKK